MLALRSAHKDDEAWLQALFATGQPALLALLAMPDGLGRPLVQMQYEARQAQYRVRWPLSLQHIILLPAAAGRGMNKLDGEGAAQEQAVGMLWTDHSAQALHVLDITLLPAWRGQGIGSRCLQALQARAAFEHCALKLQVALDNPARRLYERLGLVQDESITSFSSTHLSLIYRPQAALHTTAAAN